MARQRGRPRHSERNSFSLEDERAWYRRGVDAYLEICYRTRSRASASEFAQQFDIPPATLTRAFKRLFDHGVAIEGALRTGSDSFRTSGSAATNLT